MELLELDLNAGAAKLSVHCGVGAGTLTGFMVGGLMNRWEYVVTGDPITQIGSAEPEAEAGEVVISQTALFYVSEVASGDILPSSNFKLHSITEFEIEKQNR